MTKKLKNWTPQEEEIRRLRGSLTKTITLMAELADEDGLDTRGCIEVMQFIQQSLKRDGDSDDI